MFALVFHYELVIIRICDIKLLGIKMYEQNRPIAQTRTQYLEYLALKERTRNMLIIIFFFGNGQ